MSGINFYAGSPLDRASHLRGDDAWIEARRRDPASRFIAVWRSRNLVSEGASPRAVALPPDALASFAGLDDCAVFLGLVGESAYFAVDLTQAAGDDEEGPSIGGGRFVDLRSVGPLLPRDEAALLAYARGIVIWHRRHRYCGVCGSPTEVREAGHMRRCRNGDCGSPHFPRTDPAVIMLVEDGDRCLLGRQAVWPKGMHSTLAGFVEPGESLEEAVAREVREEVGIDLREIRYHSSQPWPFPSSIMLGFRARAAATALRVNREELEDARWFTREEVLASPEDESFRLPRRDSIARRLIEDWLEG